MPQRDLRLLLQDVRDACDLIARCVGMHTWESYAADAIVRAAVERQFEIIGEAVKRLLMIEPSLSLRIPEAKEIIEFRNFLSHGYHLIDHGLVWKIASKDAPALRSRVEELHSERQG